jgi:hypothetical protein
MLIPNFKEKKKAKKGKIKECPALGSGPGRDGILESVGGLVIWWSGWCFARRV